MAEASRAGLEGCPRHTPSACKTKSTIEVSSIPRVTVLKPGTQPAGWRVKQRPSLYKVAKET